MKFVNAALEKLCLVMMCLGGLFTAYCLIRFFPLLPERGVFYAGTVPILLGLFAISLFYAVRAYIMTSEPEEILRSGVRFASMLFGGFFLVMLLYQIVAIYQHSSLGVSTTKDVISMIVLVLLLALAFAGRSYFPANDTVKIKLPERKPKQSKPPKQSKKLFKMPAQPVVQQPEPQPVPAQESKKSGRFKPGLVSDNPEQDLQNLIGLSAVKKRILEIRAVLAYDQEMGIQNEKQSYNMMFLGAPGTGKTTVARIVAGILYDLGVVRTNRFLEVNATDLMGEYLGQTPLIVNEAFRVAAGGVLFIDEAYAFVKSVGSSSNSSFGDEAVITLLSQIEQNTDGTVVIFAGYKKEMTDFLSMNPGLRSRVPYIIDFPDYTTAEMLEILSIELMKYKHDIAPAAEEKLAIIIQAVKDRSDFFENGRYARNLAQALHSAHAMNVYMGAVSGQNIELADVQAEPLIGLSSARDAFTDEEIEAMDKGQVGSDETMAALVQALHVLGIEEVQTLTEEQLDGQYTARLSVAKTSGEKNEVTRAYQMLLDYLFT